MTEKSKLIIIGMCFSLVLAIIIADSFSSKFESERLTKCIELGNSADNCYCAKHADPFRCNK